MLAQLFRPATSSFGAAGGAKQQPHHWLLCAHWGGPPATPLHPIHHPTALLIITRHQEPLSTTAQRLTTYASPTGRRRTASHRYAPSVQTTHAAATTPYITYSTLAYCTAIGSVPC